MVHLNHSPTSQLLVFQVKLWGIKFISDFTSGHQQNVTAMSLLILLCDQYLNLK